MKKIMIIGLLITDRIKESGRTQKVLSQYAHIIRARLGFHEVSEDVCSRVGVILLQLAGRKEEWDNLVAALEAIGGVEVRTMNFEI